MARAGGQGGAAHCTPWPAPLPRQRPADAAGTHRRGPAPPHHRAHDWQHRHPLRPPVLGMQHDRTTRQACMHALPLVPASRSPLCACSKGRHFFSRARLPATPYSLHSFSPVAFPTALFPVPRSVRLAPACKHLIGILQCSDQRSATAAAPASAAVRVALTALTMLLSRMDSPLMGETSGPGRPVILPTRSTARAGSGVMCGALQAGSSPHAHTHAHTHQPHL